MKGDIMTQNGSFFFTFLHPLTTKAPVSFICEKQYRQTSKGYPPDACFFWGSPPPPLGLKCLSERLGHCVATKTLPPAPG